MSEQPATLFGVPARELTPAGASPFLGANLDVSRSLGIPIDRSPHVPRGRFYALTDRAGATTRIVVGTWQADPFEAVRREARRTVRAGMFRVTPPDLRWQHAQQHAAEVLIDQLVGSPPAWPT